MRAPRSTRTAVDRTASLAQHLSARMSSTNAPTGGQQTESLVLLRSDGPVRTLVLDRPSALNALSETMTDQLRTHIEVRRRFARSR